MQADFSDDEVEFPEDRTSETVCEEKPRFSTAIMPKTDPKRTMSQLNRETKSLPSPGSPACQTPLVERRPLFMEAARVGRHHQC